MVFSLQTGSATTNIFNQPVYIGTITDFSLTMELCYVLTAIVITGRVGAAAITAELGTMKITEQLDALYMPCEISCRPKTLSLFFYVACVAGSYGGYQYNRNMRRYDSYNYNKDDKVVKNL